MRCQIVTCLFDGQRKTRFALYREFDGKLLGWQDLDILLPPEELDDLPKPIVQQLGADGTAFFHSRNKVLQVKAVLEAL